MRAAEWPGPARRDGVSFRGASRFRSKDIKIARRAIVSGFAGNSRVLIWSSRSAASER